MDAPRTVQLTISGYRAAAPAERGGFWMLGAVSATIAASRTVNYVRERRRSAPLLRSLARRGYNRPRPGAPRVHHFVPGMALALLAGGAGILARDDGRESLLAIPFGTGAGLALDEVGLLLELDNAYWGRQRLALGQAGVAGLAAAALAGRFHRQGASVERAPLG